MEMLVVLVISALTIAISYTVLNIIGKGIVNHKYYLDQFTNYSIMYKVMHHDVFKAQEIKKEKDGFSVINDNNKIFYEINKEYIVRKSSSLDTFKINTNSVLLLYDTITVNNDNEIINKVLIDVALLKSISCPIVLYKYYDAKKRIENDSVYVLKYGY